MADSGVIESVRLHFMEVPLHLDVSHALATRRSTPSWFFTIRDRDDRVGIGEFTAREYVTGESDSEVREAAERLGALLLAADLTDPLGWLTELRSIARGWRGGRTAIGGAEMALLDLASRVEGKSIASVVGRRASADRTATYSAVYPLLPPEGIDMLNERFAEDLQASEAKVKGKGDLALDLETLEAVRSAYPGGVSLRVDLNGALDPIRANQYVEGMLSAGVDWLEQPFAKEDHLSAQEMVSRHGDYLTVVADESACSAEDVKMLLERGACNGVNIRVGKMGGMTECLSVRDLAIENGLVAQLGCLVGETSVLSYAGLHLVAIVEPLAHHEGCFGSALIGWDPVVDSLEMGRGGEVSCSRLPKHGLTPGIESAAFDPSMTWATWGGPAV